jgi:hypothetical protein
VTHLVVDVGGLLGAPVLVTRDYVASADHERIVLRCTRDELKVMDPFEQTMFIPPEGQSDLARPDRLPYQTLYPAQGTLIGPLAVPPNVAPPAVEERVPAGGIVVDKESTVEATDGEVGHVDEVISDPTTGALSYLVVRTGMLWAEKKLQVPASAIAEVDAGTVRLSVARDQLKEVTSEK